jgi:hypothetical protein
VPPPWPGAAAPLGAPPRRSRPGQGWALSLTHAKARPRATLVRTAWHGGVCPKGRRASQAGRGDGRGGATSSGEQTRGRAKELCGKPAGQGRSDERQNRSREGRRSSTRKQFKGGSSEVNQRWPELGKKGWWPSATVSPAGTVPAAAAPPPASMVPDLGFRKRRPRDG